MPDEVNKDQTSPAVANEPIAPADSAPVAPAEPVVEEKPMEQINKIPDQVGDDTSMGRKPESALEQVPVPPAPTSQVEPQAVPEAVAEPAVEGEKVEGEVAPTTPASTPPLLGQEGIKSVVEVAGVVSIKPSVEFMRAMQKQAVAAKQERMRKKLDHIMTLFEKEKQVNNDLVEKILHVSDSTVTRYFRTLVKEGKIKKLGRGYNICYEKI